MINTGKCPKCEKTISSVKIEAIEIKEGFQKKWAGVSFCCPSCSTVLGVELDPLRLQADTVKKIKGR